MGKLRLRDGKALSEGHTPSKWQRRSLYNHHAALHTLSNVPAEVLWGPAGGEPRGGGHQGLRFYWWRFHKNLSAP